LTLPDDCRNLLEALEQVTARITACNRELRDELTAAISERARAIEALSLWIVANPAISQTVRAELASRLTRDLDRGSEILVRLSLDRDAARLGLAEVARGLHMLRGLDGATSQPTRQPTRIDCRA